MTTSISTAADAAAYALEALMKAGADKAACVASQNRTDEFNVEASQFSLLRTLFNKRLALKAIKGGKKGTTVINKFDRETVDRAVANCVAMANLASPDDAEDIAEKAENKAFDQGIGGPDMASLFSRSRDFVGQLRDEFPKIMLENMTSEFNSGQTVHVNSNGVVFSTDAEHYTVGTMFSAKDGENVTSCNFLNSSITALDVPFIDLGMQRTLLEESVRSLDARMVDGKFVGKIIVTPACEDMIWGTLLDCFLGTGPLIDGTSRWKDALGSLVADPKLTFRAAPLNPLIVTGERFTDDGYESRDCDFIKDGVLASFALGLYGANKTGKPRAGNTAFWETMEVAAGDVPLTDMIKGVDRGILLNRFSGGQPGPSGDVSGVAKNSFLIENGRVTDALKETMIGFNILDVLKSIVAISTERCANGTSVLPWCCFDGVTVSGK
ncbi:MAG: metallopeptidase TldD-related protein [Treponema sp.]|nr:metallopeptidase TldD-related protein [Treponema sp.]